MMAFKSIENEAPQSIIWQRILVDHDQGVDSGMDMVAQIQVRSNEIMFVTTAPTLYVLLMNFENGQLYFAEKVLFNGGTSQLLTAAIDRFGMRDITTEKVAIVVKPDSSAGTRLVYFDVHSLIV